MTNISPQLHNSAATSWSVITSKTNDRPQPGIQWEEAIHQSRLSRLESDNLKNKKMIDDMTQQLSQLQSSIATLTNTQKKTSEELNRQKMWQDTVSAQLATMTQFQQDLTNIAKQRNGGQ